MKKVNKFLYFFRQAKTGNVTATNHLLNMYRPLLYKEAIVNGIFDEDLFQELRLIFLKCLAKFNIR